MSRALLIAAALVAGCSDDPVDLTGIYEVQLQAHSRPCGDDMPVMKRAAYLKIEKMQFLADFFAISECQDPAGLDCGGAGFFDALPEPIDNGWRGVTSQSSAGASDTCALAFNEKTAVLNGSHLLVETSRYVSLDNRPRSECTPEKADELGDKMPCEEHEAISAEKR